MDSETSHPKGATALPNSQDASVVALADGVQATLRMARGLAASGRRIDLAGLDGMVGLLCARCLDMPPELGRGMRPRLAELLGELDALRGALVPPVP